MTIPHPHERARDAVADALDDLLGLHGVRLTSFERQHVRYVVTDTGKPGMYAVEVRVDQESIRDLLVRDRAERAPEQGLDEVTGTANQRTLFTEEVRVH